MRGLSKSFLCVAVVAAIAAIGSDTRADFNGEVLISPPPPNWLGGTETETETGVQRVWQRPTDGGPRETITIERMTGSTDRTAASIAQDAGRHALGTCAQPNVTDATPEPAEIGARAAVTATCNTADGIATFALGHAFVGDFNTYSVVRTWSGDPSDPSSPAVSPRAAEEWLAYFSRAGVCNTLTSACNPDMAVMIHAHPRFETMRPLKIAAAPVLPQQDLLRGAKAIGAVTGRAAACGEDIAPLTTKIDRMFAYVTANDRDAFAAVSAFEAARTDAEKAQASAKKAGCGETLREFRQHPSRVGAFPRYIEQYF